MQSFLDKLPAEQIHSSDNLAQVAAKQKAQEVSRAEAGRSSSGAAAG